MLMRFTSTKRRLELPIYRLSEGEKPEKSCFINSTHIDTVRPDYADWIKENNNNED